MWDGKLMAICAQIKVGGIGPLWQILAFFFSCRPLEFGHPIFSTGPLGCFGLLNG